MMKRWILAMVMVLALAMPAAAQITTGSFTSSVTVSGLNTAIATLGAQALNRSGGTITGNITVSSGVTVDGVDISAVLGGSGTPTFSTLTLSSSSASALDVTGGINAGSGNVGIVDTTGKIPAISSTYFSSLSGANLTGIPVSALSGTWSDTAFSAGDYTANGTMTITVAGGDVIVNKYLRVGNTLHWTLYVLGATIGGVANSELRVDLPGSLTFSGLCGGSFAYGDNGTGGNGLFVGSNGSSYITLLKSFVTANWSAASSDNTSFAVNISCQVA